ncbi:MAG TPA: oligosaccharide flippase family protein [Pyrinomonadaceae bacterium]|nr:oligosaccharide flippase family protein [Pyrinomonadaceae bacterium]
MSTESEIQNPKSKIIQNVLWMAWSGAVSIANSVAVWVFMARLREPEEIGRFTVVMSLYMLFFTICSLGLSPFIVNEISRRIGENEKNEVERFIGTTTISLFVWGIFCAVLMTISGIIFSPSNEVRISTFVLSFAMIPTGAITCAESVSISFGRARLIAIVNTLENLLRTIIPVALIFYGFSLPMICAAFVLVRFVSLAVYFFANLNFSKLTIFDREVFQKLLKAAPTFAGITILASLNWQIVTMLLGRFSTETESAKYGVASRFLIPVMILMAGYAGVIQPLLANKENDKLGAFLSKIIKNLLLLATFASLLAPFFSEFVLKILFGENYAQSAPSLNILALTVVPFCAVMIVGRGLVATNSQHIDLIANAVGVTVCAFVGMILIPKYGAVGAATTQFLSLIAMALVEIGYLSRKILDFKVWRTAAFSFTCLLFVCVFIWK